MGRSLGLKPKPLEYVSPSRVAKLEACFLQVVFDATPRYRGKKFLGPRARLGAACHALLARITRGELAGIPRAEWRSKLEHLWNEEIAEEERLSQESPLEEHFGPARRWPGYAIQKARAMRKAQVILERRLQARSWTGRTWAERSYQAYQGRLRGRADVVYWSGEYAEIQDYKTGSIYERQEQGDNVLKSHYRKQILLYAAMRHDSTGIWPASGHIVSLTGDRESVDIDPAESEREVEVALELLERFNAQVSREHNSYALTSPSPEACRFCGYKAYCEPFWIRVSSDWGCSKNVAVDGLVIGVLTHVMADWTIQIQVRRGNVHQGVYQVCGSRRVELEEGQRLRAINLMHGETEEPTVLVATDYTELWTESLMKNYIDVE